MTPLATPLPTPLLDETGAVTLHVWRTRPRDVPRELAHARRTSRRMRRRDDVTFTKVLGTSSDDFVPTAATLTRWALLTCWRQQADVHADLHAAPAGSERRTTESATLSLRPLWARGQWDRQTPFGTGTAPDARDWHGPVVVITRATLRARRAARFYRAVPPIARALRDATGCEVAFGIGETPLLRQGTVSVWRSADAIREFAHAAPAHVAAVEATPRQRWYAEELFARFALVDADGTIDGITLP